MQIIEFVLLFSFSFLSAFAALCLARHQRTEVSVKLEPVWPPVNVVVRQPGYPFYRRNPSRETVDGTHIINSQFWLNPTFSSS